MRKPHILNSFFRLFVNRWGKELIIIEKLKNMHE